MICCCGRDGCLKVEFAYYVFEKLPFIVQVVEAANLSGRGGDAQRAPSAVPATCSPPHRQRNWVRLTSG